MKILTKHEIIILVLLLFSVSCKDADLKAQISVDLNEITFAGDASDQLLEINATADWTAEISENWCSLSATSGTKGKKQLIITATENKTMSNREAVITFSSGSVNQKVTVSQTPYFSITVNRDTFTVAPSGGDISLQVTSSISNYTYSTPDWITLKSAAADNTSQTFSITRNDLVIDRTGTIVYTAGDKSKNVSIRQTAKNIYIAPDASEMTDNAIVMAPKMLAGWNLGNTLEAIGGETAWGNPMVTQAFIDSVKAAGFNSIRIPCAWNDHLDKSIPYKIQDSWLSRVKEVVDYCYKNNMYVVLNIHWDGGWLENNPTFAKQEAVNKQQKALWTQIAYYFRDYDQHLLFAGTNEVHVDYNTPSTENITVQQSYNQTFVDAVRATGGKNYYRNLIVQSYNTNIDYAVDFMKLPTDVISKRMFVEVHYYDPWDFCGETSASAQYYWGQPYSSLGVSSWGQESHVNQQFGKMKTNFVNKGYPVILGEYGPIRRSSLTGSNLTNHLAARVYYLEYITKQAKNYGLIPFYWDNGLTNNNGNGIFNRKTGTAFDRQALDALKKGAQLGIYPY